MLYIKADEPRTLTFEVDIRGVGKGELKGYVRMFINDAEHGFPVSIDDGVITADIPPLTEIIRLKTMDDGDVIEARLDLMTDQHIFTPWEGEVKVSVPMGIKAKLSNESMKPVNKNPVIAKVVETKEDKAAAKAEPVEEGLVDMKTDETDEVKYKKDLAELVAATIKQMGLVPAQQAQPEALMEEKPANKTKPLPPKNKPKKQINEKEELMKKLRNVTEAQIYKYMERAGTKNKKIQELVYEQAAAAAQSGEPYKILRKVVEILKKRQQ
jgi:hypothetical protein